MFFPVRLRQEALCQEGLARHFVQRQKVQGNWLTSGPADLARPGVILATHLELRNFVVPFETPYKIVEN